MDEIFWGEKVHKVFQIERLKKLNLEKLANSGDWLYNAAGNVAY